MFEVNTEDMQFLFDSAGQTVLINDIEKNVIITNPTISEYDQKYIHSNEPILQGDLITLNDEKYLIITEALNKRGTKYKTLMRHCNNIITVEGETTQELVGYDDFGTPVYKTVVLNYIDVPTIIDNKNFSIDGQQVRVAINQIIIAVQDNEVNRDKFSVNNTITFEGKYKIVNRDFTKKGLMILTCESTT